MRGVAIVAGLVVCVAVGLVGVGTLLTTDLEEPEEEVILLGLEGESIGFYPYLNDATEFDGRSAINLLVRGDADALVEALLETPDEPLEDDRTRWIDLAVLDAPSDPQGEVGTATARSWSEADGAIRYAYVGSDRTDGEWIEETIHLEDGSYFGYRYHVRLYETPTGEWALLQAHSEHFDWFTLRHRVDGIQGAQAHVEQDLMTLAGVGEENVTRVYLDNTESSDSDGWTTLVDLTALIAVPVLVGMALSSGQGRLRRRHGLGQQDRRTTAVRAATLAGAIVGTVAFVRVLGLVLEAVVPLSAHAIAMLGYPIVALGIPIATVAAASRMVSRVQAATVAGFAFGLAVWLEYWLLGVGTVPLTVVGHRTLLAVALAVLAAGVATRRVDRRLLQVGLALWIGALAVAALALV